jgi:hypothetical protein
MASAKKSFKTVETITGVTLSLTLEEARTLAAVYGRVGGDPDRSPRKHADSVLDALADVGIVGRGALERDLLPSVAGAIFSYIAFDNYSTEG